MSFNPHTESDRRRMLAAVGVGSAAELFEDVPEEIRFPTLRLGLNRLPVLDQFIVGREGQTPQANARTPSQTHAADRGQPLLHM